MTRKTIADWPTLRADYVSGSMTLGELALKHRVSFRSVRYQSALGKWNAARRRVGPRIEAAVTERTVEARASQLQDWNQADLKIAKHARAKLVRTLALLGEPEGPKEALETLKTLATIVAGIEATQRIARLALGATTQNNGISNPNGGPIGITAVPDILDYYASFQIVENGETED